MKKEKTNCRISSSYMPLVLLIFPKIYYTRGHYISPYHHRISIHSCHDIDYNLSRMDGFGNLLELFHIFSEVKRITGEVNMTTFCDAILEYN